MHPDLHPPGPGDLERALGRRACPEPAADLPDRILAAVAAERQPAPRPQWTVPWRAAAAVVLALNLALSAANGLRYGSLSSAVVEPREGDGSFRAFAAGALAQLAPAPDAGPVARRFVEQQED
jgi:hypothetical protein